MRRERKRERELTFTVLAKINLANVHAIVRKKIPYEAYQL